MQLLITREQLLERTPLNGNIDTDKLIPHMVTAQDIQAQEVLGTPLYDKIIADLVTDTLAGEYLTIYEKFIVPMAAHYTAANFYLFHAFEVANGGIYRHQSETGFTPDMPDVKHLSKEQENKAIFYRNRLVDYLCYYSAKFPEYLQTSTPGLSPNRGVATNQWNLQ